MLGFIIFIFVLLVLISVAVYLIAFYDRLMLKIFGFILFILMGFIWFGGIAVFKFEEKFVIISLIVISIGTIGLSFFMGILSSRSRASKYE